MLFFSLPRSAFRVQNVPLFTISFHVLLSVCPFCKYPPPLFPLDVGPMLPLTAHFASVLLSPSLLTLQSFLIVKVLLPHSHLA